MGEATAGKISQEIGLPRPTVYRILDTLVDSGLLYRSPSAQKVYRLTEAVGRLSSNLGHVDPVTLAARRVLNGTSANLPWPVFLSTYSKDGMVLRETTRGSSVFWTQLGWVGAVAPPWEVSSGKAFIANTTPDMQQTLLEQGPPDGAAELEAIRKQGYAVDRNAEGGIIGLSVPVGEGESLVGALATFWEASDEPEPIFLDGFLATLASLSQQILEELRANPADSPLTQSV